ncbi:MAG: hypothetical protein ING36_03225 [Burkholderiales bacterium]|jgi:hypothetical protein|nr:hypothetical protein [Burkholderiales bacterium]
MSNLKNAIQEYLGSVENSLKLFEQKFGRRDVLNAWHQGVLPKEGILADNVEYELHGAGCYVSYPSVDIDFDFAPGGRSDGFDLWRLGKYLRQFPERFPEYQDKGHLESAFEQLIKSGMISQKFPEQSSLYFFE